MQAIDILWITLTCLGAYLLGSIPFSVWIGRVVKGIDLREHNTGNPGAVNAIKTFDTAVGLPIMLLDVFKGFLTIFLIDKIYSLPHFITIDGRNPLYTVMCISGPALAVLGHNYSIWIGFEGGQGMGVFMGTLLYMNPLVYMACGIGLIIPAGLFKKSGRVSGAIGVLLSIPAALFIPICPPWVGFHSDWVLGINGFVHLTQWILVAVMVLALFSSVLKNIFTKSSIGSTNWFTKNS